MGIISYAQNFEDVLLWRALGHVERGCYIDIGAHDPIVDSVSKAFYERGWRGIHVEPLPVYCDALRRDRPDETVLQAAVAAETGVLRFFDIPDTGISTGDEAIAQSHRERGLQINEITVPSVTLAQVFQLVKGDVVHWLKIDVEGLEEQVLRGWGESSLRPWIVVVESTLPLTQDEVFSAWEELLLEKGYRCVHFDGLNRYYLTKGQSALKNAFRSGPNVFDGFQFNGTANNPFCGHVAQSIRNELGDQIESLKQQALLHKTDEPRLAEALEHSEKLKQALQAEQAANLQNQNAAKALALQFEQQARRETEAQLRNAIQREQEFTAQLLAAKDQFQQQEQARGAREQQLQQQLAQAEQQFRQEIESQLRNATQREQEFTAQLLAAKEELRQEADKWSSLLEAQELQMTILHEGHNERETVLLKQVGDANQSLQQIHKHWKQREAELLENNQEIINQLQVAGFELNTIYSSFTWRMLKPLREFVNCFVRLAKPTKLLNKEVNAEQARCLLGRLDLITDDIKTNSLGGDLMMGSQSRIDLNNELDHGKRYSVDYFLNHHDKDFVCLCYRALLKRNPDLDGEKFYLDKIRSGVSRESILAQILKSREAKEKGAKIDGLAAYVLIDGVLKIPLFGNLISALIFVFNVRKFLSDFRALENHVYRLEEAVRNIEGKGVVK